MKSAVRGLRVLWLASLLAGCAWVPTWVPLIGHEDEPAAAEEVQPEGEKAVDAATPEGPCTRKGRRWAEGSRVCEDHAVTRCFADGEWRVIGSC